MTDIIQFSGDAVDSAAQRLGLELGTDTFPNPADYGLGTRADQITDFDEAAGASKASEFLAAHPTTTANKPTGAGTNNYAGIRCVRFDNSYFEFWAGLSENRYWARSYNSSYKDWVEMYTSGNSINPLDFGLGGDAVNPNLTDWDDVSNLTSGNYKQFQNTGTSILNSPPFISNASINTAFSVIATNGRKTVTLTELKQSDGGVFQRTETGVGVWSDWHVMFNSGNSVNPSDYGIGGIGGKNVGSGSVNDSIECGVFRLTTSALDTPTAATATLFVNRSYNVITQIWDNGSTRYFRRSTNNGVGWGAWRVNFDAGNSVNPLDYGVGQFRGDSPNNILGGNIDEISGGGLFIGRDALNGSASLGDNPFTATGGAFSLLNISGVNNTLPQFTTQLATRMQNSGGDVEVKVRTAGAVDFTDWVDLIHTGNTNLSEFGGVSGSIVATGVARDTTTIYFNLPINSWTQPASITVANTFQIREKRGNTQLAAGLAGTEITLFRHNKKNATLLVTVGSVLTAGDTYHLMCNAASSLITVNF